MHDRHDTPSVLCCPLGQGTQLRVVTSPLNVVSWHPNPAGQGFSPQVAMDLSGAIVTDGTRAPYETSRSLSSRDPVATMSRPGTESCSSSGVQTSDSVQATASEESNVAP